MTIGYIQGTTRRQSSWSMTGLPFAHQRDGSVSHEAGQAERCGISSRLQAYGSPLYEDPAITVSSMMMVIMMMVVMRNPSGSQAEEAEENICSCRENSA